MLNSQESGVFLLKINTKWWDVNFHGGKKSEDFIFNTEQLWNRENKYKPSLLKRDTCLCIGFFFFFFNWSKLFLVAKMWLINQQSHINHFTCTTGMIYGWIYVLRLRTNKKDFHPSQSIITHEIILTPQSTSMYPNKLSIEAFPSTLQLGYFTTTGQGPLTDDPGRDPQEESSIDA